MTSDTKNVYHPLGHCGLRWIRTGAGVAAANAWGHQRGNPYPQLLAVHRRGATPQRTIVAQHRTVSNRPQPGVVFQPMPSGFDVRLQWNHVQVLLPEHGARRSKAGECCPTGTILRNLTDVSQPSAFSAANWMGWRERFSAHGSIRSSVPAPPASWVGAWVGATIGAVTSMGLGWGVGTGVAADASAASAVAIAPRTASTVAATVVAS